MKIQFKLTLAEIWNRIRFASKHFPIQIRKIKEIPERTPFTFRTLRKINLQTQRKCLLTETSPIVKADCFYSQNLICL